ncbi:hypothetical protein LTR86_003126 [Recurvomyces mirabilis]|nr:hypothetical protein LTR86_003126 [Recurvomyces mirabilis]
MFASNFIVKNSSLKHLSGEDKLTKFAQSQTIATGSTMENSFCSVCGTLMYRRSSGFPTNSVLRIGTVDDFNLHETKLKPRIEQFTKDRVGWFHGGEGVKQVEGNYYTGGKEWKDTGKHKMDMMDPPFESHHDQYVRTLCSLYERIQQRAISSQRLWIMVPDFTERKGSEAAVSRAKALTRLIEQTSHP